MHLEHVFSNVVVVSSSDTSLPVTRGKIKMYEHIRTHTGVFVCLMASACECMHVYGSFSSSKWWLANLAWFSTICYLSRHHIRWIGNECTLFTLQTTTMSKPSMRIRDRLRDYWANEVLWLRYFITMIWFHNPHSCCTHYKWYNKLFKNGLMCKDSVTKTERKKNPWATRQMSAQKSWRIIKKFWDLWSLSFVSQNPARQVRTWQQWIYYMNQTIIFYSHLIHLSKIYTVTTLKAHSVNSAFVPSQRLAFINTAAMKFTLKIQ